MTGWAKPVASLPIESFHDSASSKRPLWGWNVVVVNAPGNWRYASTCHTHKEARAQARAIRAAHPSYRKVFAERSYAPGV